MTVSTRTYGSKYDASLVLAEIAKRMRKDIAAAVKVGELPRGKYGVTISRFAGGQSIDISIKEVAIQVHPIERLAFRRQKGAAAFWEGDLFTPEACALQKALEAIMAAYNYNGSDIDRDHWDVRFYGHAAFSGDILTAEMTAYAAGPEDITIEVAAAGPAPADLALVRRAG